MSEKGSKTVRLSENTCGRLAAYGSFGESYEDVIKRILDEYEEMKNREHKKENPLEGCLISVPA
jgi:hypothetical protein